ncbi:ABC transporter permease [Nocardioides bruguierae]|uniref:Xylose transport system permease protein XylH n=1 Tax=Nocardioides bruguierae TaxID=2945102 RepID=A0A9X2D7Q6_9ACTN|nr:ABC transporter permease [Nocardioides bruguierae]MCM0620895.1 ABC transporter permease [Nocardioides bruguierae]
MARRPEFSALMGTIFVFLFFSWFGRPNFLGFAGTATWVNVAAELALISLPVALVMIAGHLDLSVGSVLAAGAMTFAILSGYYGLPSWIGVIAGLAVGALLGLVNGLLVTKVKLPSFIVTLATMFSIQGIVYGVTRLTTGTVLVSVQVDEGVKNIFGGLMFDQFETAVLFALAMVLVVSWIVYRTRFGNWVYAIGGDEVSARAAGVPVDRTTVMLYIGSGFGSALLGVIQVALYSSAQVSAGQSYVFNSIIAVVVGGVLLTGGFGSPIGVLFGTMTFAIVYQGIYYTGWDSDWSALILGMLLLIAVLSNNTFRKLAMSAAKPKDKKKPAPGGGGGHAATATATTTATEKKATNV